MKRFERSVLASIFSTAVDFGSLTGLVELFGVDYVVATFVGTILGFATNFLLNRFWAFDVAHHDWRYQLLRALPIQVGSTVWQTLGVWLVTRFGKLPYEISKLVVATAVYLGWNYPMNKWFVFRVSRAAPAESATSAARPPA